MLLLVSQLRVNMRISRGCSSHASARPRGRASFWRTLTDGWRRWPQGIESIFKGIGCDKSSLSSGIMGTTGVSESNMMAYLGIIEHRTNQLLHRFQVLLMLFTRPCSPIRAS